MLWLMDLDAHTALNRFAAHAEHHRTVRQPGVEPLDSDVSERELILDELLEASGLSAKQIQEGLGINRTTWDRWRKMTSVPNRTHLDHLRRIIQEKIGPPSSSASSPSLPNAIGFLSGSPHTYSQLRVAFLHRNYNWKDAVFHFKKPFADDHSVVDMASLALNGCKIVYLLDSSLLSTPEGEGWVASFVRDMVGCLGFTTTSLALANFAFVEIVDSEGLMEMGVLNFLSYEEEERVGYTWKGNSSDDAKAITREANKYSPELANNNAFLPLKWLYLDALCAAFEEIRKNESRGFEGEWDIHKKKVLYRLPKINAKTNNIETISVYV